MRYVLILALLAGCAAPPMKHRLTADEVLRRNEIIEQGRRREAEVRARYDGAAAGAYSDARHAMGRAASN